MVLRIRLTSLSTSRRYVRVIIVSGFHFHNENEDINIIAANENYIKS